jgi:sugar phosphate isomerase/epimerase
MRRLSMNEFSTFRWTFDRDVRQYAEAGYAGIGLWRRKLADFGEEDGIALLFESGLAVSSLLWAGGFTGSGGLAFEESVDDALEAIRLGAAINAHCVVIHPGGRNNHIHKQAWRLLDDALERLLPVAEMLDVKLALEPMHPAAASQWTFITSIDAAMDTLARLPSRHLGIVFDLYHFGRCEASIERAVANVEDIAVVQLADSRALPDDDQDRCLLGHGQIPLACAIDRLERAGYQGFYDVEIVGPEIVPDQYDRVVRGSLDAIAEIYPKLM